MARGLLLGTLLLASALPAAAQQRRNPDEEYQSRIDTTFAFDRRGTVVLSIAGGEIVVRAWNRDQVQVRARSERSVVRLDATSTRVSLDLSRPRGGDTYYELNVPVGTRVSARATTGDVDDLGHEGRRRGAHAERGPERRGRRGADRPRRPTPAISRRGD